MAASANPDTFELNLTPLLDVVLQLIMFFMMCVNFVSDQVNVNVLLPTSASVQEIQAKGDADVVVVNVEVVRKEARDASGNILRDKDGKPIKELVLPKRTKLIFGTEAEIVFYDHPSSPDQLRAEQAAMDVAGRAIAEIARRKRRQAGKRPEDKDFRLPTTAVIRADAETTYGVVASLIHHFAQQNFKATEVRVMGEGRPRGN